MAQSKTKKEVTIKNPEDRVSRQQWWKIAQELCLKEYGKVPANKGEASKLISKLLAA